MVLDRHVFDALSLGKYGLLGKYGSLLAEGNVIVSETI